MELILRIEAEVYPDRNIAVRPNVTALPDTSSEKICFSEALQILVDEHKLIKHWLALIPDLAKNLDLTSEKDRQVIEDGIDFICSYADRLHHGKEEDILFTNFDDSADTFQVIYKDHERARSFVQEMLRALEEKNTGMLVSNMLEYAALLKEHIHKEDEVLFPWLDGRLTKEEKEELVARFEQSNRNLSMDNWKYQIFIEGLEQQYK